MKNLQKSKKFNTFIQIIIPSFTIISQVAFALKLLDWSLFVNLVGQPFWLYSSWKSYKNANQLGMFITSIIFTIVTLFGVVNYWIL